MRTLIRKLRFRVARWFLLRRLDKLGLPRMESEKMVDHILGDE